jgi:hypothetical protein
MHLNSINQFGFVVENHSVFSEVDPEFLINVTRMNVPMDEFWMDDRIYWTL